MRAAVALLLLLLHARTAYSGWGPGTQFYYDTTCDLTWAYDGYTRPWKISHNSDPITGNTISATSYMDASLTGPYAPGYFFYATTCPLQLPISSDYLMYNPWQTTAVSLVNFVDLIYLYGSYRICDYGQMIDECRNGYSVSMGEQTMGCIKYGSVNCWQSLYRCPTCPAWQTPVGNCAGREHDSVGWSPCIDCAGNAGNNAVWQGPACTAVKCDPGYTNNGRSNTICLPCPQPAPSGAILSTSTACAWNCPEGQYYDGVYSCVACPTRPVGAITRTGLTWGGGADVALCNNWNCPIGTYVAYGYMCLQCPYDWYQSKESQSPTCEGNCYVYTRQNRCNAGTYPVFNAATCQVIECHSCGGAPVPGTYWDIDTTTGRSSFAFDICFASICPSTTDRGVQYVGCGGTSPGTRVACTLLPIWYGDSGNASIPALYYTSGCTTDACAPCLNANMFNSACPAKNGPSIDAGRCDATCTPIRNGYYTLPRTAPVANANDCPFLCYPGFKRAGVGCVACTNSSICNAGFYAPGCSQPCQSCASPIGMTAVMWKWLLVSKPTYDPGVACKWSCALNYYLRASDGVCVACTTANCPNGYYRDGQCLRSDGAVDDSQCVPCDAVGNATLVGPGWLGAATCPLQCNAGFFNPTATRQCVPWTPSGSCNNTVTLRYNWTGGTPTVDQHCVLCPNLPTTPTYTVQWSDSPLCAWVCAAGYYLLRPLTCVACAPGMYSNASGLGPACLPCPDGTYTSDTASQRCTPVPVNSDRLSGAVGFRCMQSFQRDPSGTGCVQCVAGATDASSAIQSMHMASAAWNPEACTLSAFACVPGYYRIASNATCQPCPFATGAILGGSTARAVSLCGVWPSCPSPVDELSAACPPTATGCKPGYYVTYAFPNAAARVSASQCVPCANMVGCPAGYTVSPCQGGQQQNPCAPCPLLGASAGLIYVASSSCVVGCAAGYAYTGGATCQACGAGTYQSLSGITASGSCPNCPAGTYSPAVGASACVACAPGWVPNLGSSVCTQCALGSAGTAACAVCLAGTYAPQTGLSACIACPSETPASSAGASACTLPIGSVCPNGFYYSNASSSCVGCPEGTYCPAGNASAPILCPLGTPPAARLSASAAACKANAAGAWRSVAGDPAPCPANTSTFNLTGATSIAWCYPRIGYYGLPGAVAQPCPYDAYCPPPARNYTLCPTATPFAPLMSNSSAACSANMWQPCRPGFYVSYNEVGLASVACRPCPNSSYCLGQVWPNGTLVMPQTPSGNNALACASTNSLGAWYTDQGASTASMCRTRTLSMVLPGGCPAFTTTIEPSNVTSTLQCRANPGYFLLPGTAIAQCPAGYYCPAYSVEPLLCAKTANCTTLGTQPNAAPCGATGTISPGAACIPCAGTLPTNGGYWTTDCKTCCGAGYWLVGTACAPVSSLCGGVGLYMPSVPACASNLPTCVACPASLVSGAVAISSAVGFDVGVCQYACPVGTCGPAVTMGPSDNGTCAPAAPGYYASAGVCTPCPNGTYRFDGGAAACLPCPPSATPLGVAQTLCACGAGSASSVYANGTQQCTPCPPGTVSTLASVCQTCAPGTAWAPASAWLTGYCGPGTYRATPATSVCQPCDAGAYATGTEGTACLACASGTYASATGLTRCDACGPGNYSSGVACIPCPMNGSSVVNGVCACPAGTFLEGALCLACASRCTNGSVVVPRKASTSGCTMAGVSASDFACAASTSACTEGTYYANQSKGCVACRTCPAPSTTVAPCAVGSTRDTSRCVCPQGYYYRWNDCFPCTRTCGPYASLTALCALGATDDTSVCACSGGAYGDGIRCTCPALTYRHSNGTCVQCAKCGPTYAYAATCLEGATNDTTLCVPLSTSSCGAGTYATATTRNCTLCGVGTYSTSTGATACALCVAGTYYNGSGAQACTPCANGTYGNTTGVSACATCGVGTYASTTSASACATCAAGAYASGVGSTNCSACPLGKYSASASVCAQCPLGAFSNASGLSACLVCGAGTYLNATSDTACAVCAVGKYSSAVGAWIGVSSPSLDAGASVSANGFPVGVGVGQYCKQFAGGYSLGVVPALNDCQTDSYAVCFPAIGMCPWSYYSGACNCIGSYYNSAAGDTETDYACAKACLSVASCVNGANGIFTGAGTSASTCPVTCNPGFYLSAGYCLANPTCLPCAYANRTGATACAP